MAAENPKPNDADDAQDARDAVLGLQEQENDENDVQAHVMIMSSVSYAQGGQQIC